MRTSRVMVRVGVTRTNGLSGLMLYWRWMKLTDVDPDQRRSLALLSVGRDVHDSQKYKGHGRGSAPWGV